MSLSLIQAYSYGGYFLRKGSCGEKGEGFLFPAPQTQFSVLKPPDVSLIPCLCLCCGLQAVAWQVCVYYPNAPGSLAVPESSFRLASGWPSESYHSLASRLQSWWPIGVQRRSFSWHLLCCTWLQAPWCLPSLLGGDRHAEGLILPAAGSSTF